MLMLPLEFNLGIVYSQFPFRFHISCKIIVQISIASRKKLITTIRVDFCSTLLQDSCEDWDQVGSKGGAKVRLQRSHAIRDSTSPPPSVQSANHQCPHQNQAQGNMSEGGSERSTGIYLSLKFNLVEKQRFSEQKGKRL